MCQVDDQAGHGYRQRAAQRIQSPLLAGLAPGVAAQNLEQTDQARHVWPHAQTMQAAQAEGQQHYPEPAEHEQHGDGVGVVEHAAAVLALAQAQAHRQADTQLAGFGAIALQPGQQQAEAGEQRQADQRVGGRPEAQAGTARTQTGEQQHAQHAEAVQRIGLGGLEGADRRPQEPRVGTEQTEQQWQGATQTGDYRRAPGGWPGMPAEQLPEDLAHAQTGLERPVISRAISVA